MKRLLILLLIFVLIPCLCYGQEQFVRVSPMLMGGGVPAAAPPSGWSDDFSAADGDIEGSTPAGMTAAWDGNTYPVTGGEEPGYGNRWDRSTEIALQSTVNGPECYLFSTYAPTSANYYVEANRWVNSESSRYVGLIIRGTKGTDGNLNKLNGYAPVIATGSNVILWYKYTNGSSAQLGTTTALNDYDWTSSSRKIKVTVSGTTTTTITVFIDDVEIDHRDDSSSPFTAPGFAGLYSNQQPDSADNFVIGY